MSGIFCVLLGSSGNLQVLTINTTSEGSMGEGTFS